MRITSQYQVLKPWGLQRTSSVPSLKKSQIEEIVGIDELSTCASETISNMMIDDAEDRQTASEVRQGAQGLGVPAAATR